MDDGTLPLPDAERAPPADDVPAVGQRLGRFVIRGVLGAGGMGVVLAAHDPDLDRPIALKVLRDSGAAGYRARLVREAQAMARLHHPNVVSVYEVGQDGDRLFVAMELVIGTTLTRWLAGGARSWREVVAMFLAAGAGLAAAHRAGLVHRDFKPDNVLVDAEGGVRVADFGLARLDDDGVKVTQSGAVMGTPGYMAPEQHWGADVDARADQYSFCVALRSALSRPSSRASEPTADLRGPRAAPPPRAEWRDVPRRVRAVIDRGLAFDAGDRWSGMDPLLAALAASTRDRRLAIAAGVGVVGAIAGVIVFAATRAPGERASGPAPVAVVAPAPVVAADASIAPVAAPPTPAPPAPTPPPIAIAPADAAPATARGRDRDRGDARPRVAAAPPAPPAPGSAGNIPYTTMAPGPGVEMKSAPPIDMMSIEACVTYRDLVEKVQLCEALTAEARASYREAFAEVKDVMRQIPTLPATVRSAEHTCQSAVGVIHKVVGERCKL